MISDDFKKYVSDVLRQQIYYPALALSGIMDILFGDEDWWEFEYETILQELERAGLPKPNVNILGEIQCLSAIRRGKSFVDQEWHLFEKTCAALTGIPVLFYEKQNLPIENVVHAMHIMEKLTKVEYSEEVEHYIGSEAINDELFWYPTKEVDDYLMKAMNRMKEVLGLDMTRINYIRDRVKNRFNEYARTEMDKAEFKENSVEDQMCKRIFASLLHSKQLLKDEDDALNMLSNVRSGVFHYTGNNQVSTVIDNPTTAITVPTASDVMDIEMPEEDYTPLAFTDGVKEAMLNIHQKIANFMVDPFEGMGVFNPVGFVPPRQSVVIVRQKVASIPGSPIQTGVSVGNIFPEERSEHFEQEETDSYDGSAEEIMQQVADAELTEAPQLFDRELEEEDPFMG